ncbi:MAG TPA: MFS transporter, partial [Symbiobacteriaceae bacterium]|nr:MFS transporter [Symbiobacteriaceae bacterium]
MQQWQKNVYVLWVAVLIASATWSMVMPFMPVFLEKELGVTQGVSAWAGVLGAVNSLGMALMSPVWGAMGDRYGRKMMMMRAGISLVVCYGLLSLVRGPYELLGVRIMIGALTGFIPTATALVGTTTPQEHVGKALALVTTAGPTGTILGPLLGGLLWDLVGMRMSMASGSVALAIATLMVLLFVKEEFTPDRREQANLLADMGEVLHYRGFAVLLVTTTLGMAAMGSMEPVMIPFIKTLVGESAP